MTLPKSVPALSGAAVVLLALSACSSGQNTSADGTAPITVSATDTACEVAPTSVKAGNLTFEVTNKGTKVTEFYLYGEGDKIIGEVENIAPGLARKLTVAVPAAGTYQAACKPGMAGDGIRVPLTVTGAAAQPAADSALTSAAKSYAGYVATQAGTLKTETQKFADAVKAGRVDEAKARYANTRVYYEHLEPVAEKFSDLDKAIDVREADVEQGKPFTGFHRLEKDLWATGLQPDSGRIADQLVADVTTLTERSATLGLTALELANGAKELLDEVATGKVTGEEEAFSHTDLWDFQANVDGSKGAIEALRPVLQARDPQLMSTVDSQFANVQRLLDKQRNGDGFRYYTELSSDQIKELASAVDALGEPLSKVAEVVAR
ncbi:peptidase M75 family protein [Amycolatopsis rhizosphaerae]|uniref:Peptidase M75 family protein n=1 Tax=Amycolatopsis rhizosphaerae TaxID=2053003 RepID=A0A558CV87_9PSEU|nr:iron uptake system protein EfeO [Amycolatopsis rhizosphaerae]TVT52688.1 peptidase M75 family protein [Amycolatopsis rhizosphaerae]